MKQLILIFAIFLFACSDKNNPVSELQNDSVIPYDSSNDVFSENEIKYSDFLGEWRLVTAKFKCALGELTQIENKYIVRTEDKHMLVEQNRFSKLCFWRNPEFLQGSIGKNNSESLKNILWTPAGGAPSFIMKINYTDTILTLRYSSQLLVDNKFYAGDVYETYIKK